MLSGESLSIKLMGISFPERNWTMLLLGNYLWQCVALHLVNAFQKKMLRVQNLYNYPLFINHKISLALKKKKRKITTLMGSTDWSTCSCSDTVNKKTSTEIWWRKKFNFVCRGCRTDILYFWKSLLFRKLTEISVS